MIKTKDDYISVERNKHKLFFKSWIPENKENYKKTVVFIVHGMAEHITRYDDFARYLSERGYVICGTDLRGHGKSVANEDELGYLCDNGGFDKISEDIHDVILLLQREFPGHNIIILGHSMGSFISRRYIQLYPNDVNGLILSGTASGKGLIGKIGILIANLIIAFKGRKYVSMMLDKMSFGNFNRKIQNPKTKFDWLSNDENIVEEYINDPKCGFVFKAGAFLDLFRGIDTIHKRKNMAKIRNDLPMLLISGTEDPVGNYGKGPAIVHKRYSENGNSNITLKLFEGYRHEILNEINRENVYKSILEWLYDTNS